MQGHKIAQIAVTEYVAVIRNYLFGVVSRGRTLQFPKYIRL